MVYYKHVNRNKQGEIEVREIFAERLKRRQVQLKLNQAQLAELINVAPGTCSSYLKMEKVPTLEKAAEIAAALGVSVGWLCGEDSKPGRAFDASSTYADVVNTLNALNEVEWEAETRIEIETMEHSTADGFSFPINCVSFKTSDPVLVKFFNDYKRIKDMHESGIIDDELHGSWLEKRLESLEQQHINLGAH